MQDDRACVMSAGSETVEAAIEHVRKGRERIPMADLCVGESPRDAAQRQPGGNGRILIDVKAVVVVNEVVMPRLAEDDPDEYGQPHADEAGHPQGSPDGAKVDH